jgi:hypothetical protein
MRVSVNEKSLQLECLTVLNLVNSFLLECVQLAVARAT